MKFSKVWIWVGLLTLLYFGGRYLYFQPKHDEGVKVPEFEATLEDGGSFEIIQLKDRIVLIDFWGSWCVPCLSKMPELKSFYQTFHDRDFRHADGFEIVSIAIERDERKWRTALSMLDMTWPYQILDRVSNYRFFDGPLSRQFGVKKLPSSFLIDAKGNIIKLNPTPAEVESYLASQLDQ